MLRLEQLFDRLGQLMVRDTAVDHHFALVTLFEIMDVASRADLKSDLLKELERHKQQLHGSRGNPSRSRSRRSTTSCPAHRAGIRRAQPVARQSRACAHGQRVADEHAQPHQHPGRHLRVRPACATTRGSSREPASRRADLTQWVVDHDAAGGGAAACCCGLLRDSGVPQKVVAKRRPVSARPAAGQDVPAAARADGPGAQLMPEISGHRLMVSVRLMRQDAEGRCVRATGTRPSSWRCAPERTTEPWRRQCGPSDARPAAAEPSTPATTPGARFAASVAEAWTSAPGPASAYRVASPPDAANRQRRTRQHPRRLSLGHRS